MQALQNPNTALILLGFVAIILEIILGAATGFELLILGIVFIIGGGVGMLTGSIQLAIGSIIALILGYIVFGRRRIKNALHITTKATNSESIISKQAKVVSEIPAGEHGQVKIDGEVWRATSTKNHKMGTTVTIDSISGVTVRVT
ncbi:MAG: NfeD family protein [bacterium]|nr:NfeD family protein [bacterium]